MEPLLPHGQAKTILIGGFLTTAPKTLPHFEQVIVCTRVSSFQKLASLTGRSFNEKYEMLAHIVRLAESGKTKNKWQ